MTMITGLLFLLLASAFGADTQRCRLVLQDHYNCSMETKPIKKQGCEAETVFVDECKNIENKEQCTTEHETVCEGERATEGTVDTKHRVKAALARAGIQAEIQESASLEGETSARTKRSLPFTKKAITLKLKMLAIHKLLKLKALLVGAGLWQLATGVGVSTTVGRKKRSIKLRKGKDEDETCFEIPRTVCPMLPGASLEDHSKAAYNNKDCVTTMKIVCGANTYRNKRSVPEGCNLQPVKQNCIKKEGSYVCQKVKQEVYSHLPEDCFQEQEVCVLEKVEKEVCN